MTGKIDIHILDKDQHEQLVEEFKAQCLSEDKVGFALPANNIPLPCITVDKELFKKLAQAGSIDVISNITTFNLPPHLYIKLKILWPSIRKNLTLILNGWRDRTWLELLCCMKKIALTPQDLKVPKPIYGSIIVDGINVDKLRLILAVTSMFDPPKDF